MNFHAVFKISISREAIQGNFQGKAHECLQAVIFFSESSHPYCGKVLPAITNLAIEPSLIPQLISTVVRKFLASVFCKLLEPKAQFLFKLKSDGLFVPT